MVDWPSEEGGFADEAQRCHGWDGARGIAEGYEDTALGLQRGARDIRPIYLTPYKLYGATNQIK